MDILATGVAKDSDKKNYSFVHRKKKTSLFTNIIYIYLLFIGWEILK